MSISWGEEKVHAAISGLGDELEDAEGECRALTLFFLSSFPVPLCSSSYVRDQTPAGRLLVSQMSGLRGKMQLVLCEQQESPGRSSVDVITAVNQRNRDDNNTDFCPPSILLTS